MINEIFFSYSLPHAVMLRGENIRFRPAIFIWFVFAQSFFKFHKNDDNRKLNDFCRLYNELARALQSSITFFLIQLSVNRYTVFHAFRQSSDDRYIYIYIYIKGKWGDIYIKGKGSDRSKIDHETSILSILLSFNITMGSYDGAGVCELVGA